MRRTYLRRDEWDKTRSEFLRIAAINGVYAIAEQVPAGPNTIYRLIRGETDMPTRAVRAGIERIVREHQQQEN